MKNAILGRKENINDTLEGKGEYFLSFLPMPKERKATVKQKQIEFREKAI